MDLPSEWGEPYANGDDESPVGRINSINLLCDERNQNDQSSQRNWQATPGLLVTPPPLPKKFLCDPVYIGAEHM